ncbi:MAG: hypothetical protein IJ856_01130 [Candidatus Methanomethylophilaceae archaeon]|nr:hypothetical protein [Candidatus Methanomethylophilaceae archaeon]
MTYYRQTVLIPFEDVRKAEAGRRAAPRRTEYRERRNNNDVNSILAFFD